jgi:hypothetical protein
MFFTPYRGGWNAHLGCRAGRKVGRIAKRAGVFVPVLAPYTAKAVAESVRAFAESRNGER